MDKKLAALAEDVEAALAIREDLAENVIAVISERTNMTLEKADLDSSDKVLEAIHALKPGWSVSVKGTARQPNGHWRCTLRRSLSRDNDEYIGAARGPTLAHALLAALLKAMALASA